MQRREIIALLGGAAVWPLVARGEQGDRIWRIGYFTGTSADDPESKARRTAFEQGLQQLGWTQGRNVPQTGRRISRARAGRHRVLWQFFDRNAASGDSHRAGRIHDRPRPGRLRLRR